jgi:molecular chaperone HscA
MKLLQIVEPEATLKTPDQNEIAVGIDLGTTNSLIAFVIDGKAQIIKDHEGDSLLPSVVSLEGSNVLVGKQAIKMYGNPGAITINSVKRLMGRDYNDIESGLLHYPSEHILQHKGSKVIKFATPSREITAVEISSYILLELKKRAEERLCLSVTKAVITVPAYFDDAARAATKDAAKLAGLEVLRLVNEPTAAALAYGLDKSVEGTYLIYDLGGGTFDVSILNMQKGVFQVLATGGDSLLGGDDFDQILAKDILGILGLSEEAMEASLYQVARRAKEKLSYQNEIDIVVNVQGEEKKISYSVQRLEQLVKPYVDKTIRITEQALEDAATSTLELNGIVLVGGATRMPLIKKQLAAKFGKRPIDDIDPDEVVAIGAALQADNLTRQAGHLLLDVVPLSLGLELLGGVTEKIIYRNTPIPVSVTKEFTTYQDYQQGMQFHIVQGEREMAADCRSLAHFELTSIPPLKSGIARVEVNFTVDADGLLTVTAKEQQTGTTQTIEVKPSYGLTVKEIENMLYNAFQSLDEDQAKRMLAEAMVSASRLIQETRDSLSGDHELLNEVEHRGIEEKITLLEASVKAGNYEKINSTYQELEKLVDKFANRKIDKYIGAALKGKTVAEAELVLDKDKEE